MTSIYIESEGDIDFGVSHCLDLAKSGRKVFITLAFPSDLMYNIFISSLYDEADRLNIPEINMEANIVLPPKENGNGKCTGSG
jgi:hypothetical protein